MKIKSLSLIEETESHYIFEVVYQSFFREIKEKIEREKYEILKSTLRDKLKNIFN